MNENLYMVHMCFYIKKTCVPSTSRHVICLLCCCFFCFCFWGGGEIFYRVTVSCLTLYTSIILSFLSQWQVTDWWQMDQSAQVQAALIFLFHFLIRERHLSDLVLDFPCTYMGVILCLCWVCRSDLNIVLDMRSIKCVLTSLVTSFVHPEVTMLKSNY